MDFYRTDKKNWTMVTVASHPRFRREARYIEYKKMGAPEEFTKHGTHD